MNQKEEVFIKSVLKHKALVNYLIKQVTDELTLRAFNHDLSKTRNPEMAIHMKYSEMLSGLEYGSDEYISVTNQMLEEKGNHYVSNRHHPESRVNGIKDMTLVDLIEMLCDWYAASLNHKGGDIYKSLEINQERFGYSDELKGMFENTIRELEESEIL